MGASALSRLQSPDTRQGFPKVGDEKSPKAPSADLVLSLNRTGHNSLSCEGLLWKSASPASQDTSCEQSLGNADHRDKQVACRQ